MCVLVRLNRVYCIVQGLKEEAKSMKQDDQGDHVRMIIPLYDECLVNGMKINENLLNSLKESYRVLYMVSERIMMMMVVMVMMMIMMVVVVMMMMMMNMMYIIIIT